MKIGISILKGQTIKKIIHTEHDEIYFALENKKYYKIFHDQFCCELFEIDNTCGDYEKLLNEPVLIAEKTSKDILKDCLKSVTWSFYKLGTRLGYVTIRWYCISNGQYSANVNFEEISEREYRNV